MPSFTFSNYDVGNSAIVPDKEGPIFFTIRTRRSIFHEPIRTTVTSSGTEDKDLAGAIDWKKKTIEVKGVTKLLMDVKRNVGPLTV